MSVIKIRCFQISKFENLVNWQMNVRVRVAFAQCERARPCGRANQNHASNERKAGRAGQSCAPMPAGCVSGRQAHCLCAAQNRRRSGPKFCRRAAVRATARVQPFRSPSEVWNPPNLVDERMHICTQQLYQPLTLESNLNQFVEKPIIR
jgi:hypothetical protein